MELCSKGNELNLKAASIKTRLEVTPAYVSSFGDGIERRLRNTEWDNLYSSLGAAIQSLTKHLAGCKNCSV